MKKVVKLNEFGSSLAVTKSQPLGDRGLVRAVDPEVLERPRRRKFSAEYKLKILREAERAKDSGQLGGLLRREGLYTIAAGQKVGQNQRSRVRPGGVESAGERRVPRVGGRAQPAALR